MKRVLVIGTGPAGLVCAHELSKSKNFKIDVMLKNQNI
ncbi:NAD(P)-binding protein [candidate division KSB1 bacterium]